MFNIEEKLDFLIQYLINEKEENIDIPKDYESKRLLFRSLRNIRPSLKTSDEFIKVQDEFLRNELLDKGIVKVDDIVESREKFKLWQGDITRLEVDAIVNAANSKLLGCFIPLHNCIDNAIHSAAGIQLRDECAHIMRNRGVDEVVGSAKITKGYNLPSKYVIHTVGPQIPMDCKPTKNDCDELSSCYKSCLEIADVNHLESIAFCCISTGVFNFPQEMACEIAIKTIKDYINNNLSTLKDIIFCVFSDKDYSIYKKALFGDDY